jgi:hypothetical protein
MRSAEGQPTDGKKQDRSALSFETLGMIVAVVLILAIVIARSWHFMKWSFR